MPHNPKNASKSAKPRRAPDAFDEELPPRVTLRCRICGREFRGRYSWLLEGRVLGHIDLVHPDEALPHADEYAEFAKQADAEYKRLGLE